MFELILANLFLIPTYGVFFTKDIAPIGWAFIGTVCTIIMALFVSESVSSSKGLFIVGVNILVALGLCYSYMPEGASLFHFPLAATAGITVGVVFASLLAGIFTLNYKGSDKYLYFWMMAMSTVLNSLPFVSHVFF